VQRADDSQRRFWESEFEGSDLNLAGWTKKLTGKPTVTVGSVGLSGDFRFEGFARAAVAVDAVSTNIRPAALPFVISETIERPT
jgi:hypothetical protein